MTLIEYLKVGGQFTFPKSKATKTAEQMQNRDLRNNLVSNSTKGYIKKSRVPNRIKKGKSGLKFNEYTDVEHNIDVDFDNSNINTDYLNQDLEINLSPDKDLDNVLSIEQIKSQQISQIKPKPIPMQKYNKYVGYSEFDKAYNEVEEEMPEAKQYRPLLTAIAEHESGFKMGAKNPKAPAYGYFQFMQDGSKWNNIKQYSGLSIEQFTKDPKAQIKAAVKLAQSFYKSFKKEDLEKAQKMGISMTGLIGGAWLGGPGGVRKVLNGTGNPSDRHWNNGQGDDVASCMQKYNNL